MNEMNKNTLEEERKHVSVFGILTENFIDVVIIMILIIVSLYANEYINQLQLNKDKQYNLGVAKVEEIILETDNVDAVVAKEEADMEYLKKKLDDFAVEKEEDDNRVYRSAGLEDSGISIDSFKLNRTNETILENDYIVRIDISNNNVNNYTLKKLFITLEMYDINNNLIGIPELNNSETMEIVIKSPVISNSKYIFISNAFNSSKLDHVKIKDMKVVYKDDDNVETDAIEVFKYDLDNYRASIEENENKVE